MALCLVHIQGPGRDCKVAWAKRLTERLQPDLPYFVEMQASDSTAEFSQSGLFIRESIQTRRFEYHPDLLFEQFPRFISTVKAERRWATVILDSDGHAMVRHACPFDVQVFIMPAPVHLHDVFRTDDEAEEALASMMEDTITFAREMYGLSPNIKMDESRFSTPVIHNGGVVNVADDDFLTPPNEYRRAPIGDVATRAQLRPAYQGILDSDVVVIDTSFGACSSAVDETAERLEWILAGLAAQPRGEPLLALCDYEEVDDPMAEMAVRRVIELVSDVKAGWP